MRCEHCGKDIDCAREERHRENNLALIREITKWLEEKKEKP